jgi:hypothetical protein
MNEFIGSRRCEGYPSSFPGPGRLLRLVKQFAGRNEERGEGFSFSSF